jgi:hypothetical protein
MNLNRKWGLTSFVVGSLLGSASTGYIMYENYERELVADMLMRNSINILGNINVLNSLNRKNYDQAINLLENDLDTDLITIKGFQEHITERVSENVMEGIKAASDYRKKHPFTTENEEWNSKVKKILGKYK